LTFLALVALARSQCNPAGNTYQAGGLSFTFGAAVGDWIPAIEYFVGNGMESAWFMTVSQQTGSRWEVLDVAFYGDAIGDCGDTPGQYSFQFSTDCQTLSMETIFDECGDRSEAMSGVSLSLVDSPFYYGSEQECGSYTGTLGASTEEPHLSGEPVSIFPAPANLTIVSVGSRAAFFQLWTRRTADPINFHLVQDLLSVPAGFACEERLYGQYFLTESDNCGAVICGKADACPARAQLWQGVQFNDYTGDECDNDITVIEWPNSGCSDGNLWTKSPQECTATGDGTQCAFCHGVANGMTVKTCIERNGGKCNHIFRSLPAKGWCNLEFECPASTLSLSVFAFLALSLVVLFQ